MVKSLKISSIISLVQKSTFGEGKYYGYKKHKYLGIIKIITNKKIVGYGETLVGVYSPKLFKLNLEYISIFLKNKNINDAFHALQNLKRNKFFFDNGILKSIISGIQIALIDVLAQANKTSHIKILANYLKRKKPEAKSSKVYASAGSIISNIEEFKKDIKSSKNLDINCFKGRISAIQNYSEKIKIMRNEIPNFAIDLISNTFNKNNNIKKINSLISHLNLGKHPLWIEEVLRSDLLNNFFLLNKKNINYSYGENFNSIFDFYNLINYYKFNYINPDLSHFDIFELNTLSKYMANKFSSKKIILHCWGGSINFIFSIMYSLIDNDQVKLVEFPITKSNFMDKCKKKINIHNSYCYIDDFSSFSEVLDINKLEKIKNSKLTFNF